MDPKNVNISYEALQSLAKFVQDVNKGITEPESVTQSPDYVSPFAAWLLAKADQTVATKSGKILSKSDVDEITLDFTMGRTLSEEQAIETIRFIYDKSPYLQMFNSRSVNTLVAPMQGRVITKENLISNEQAGAAVESVNRRIVHNFGINLFLKHFNLQKNIPLQTVIDNAYNPNFEADTMNDVAIALANDILLLATNGLEYESYATSENFYDLNKGFVRILQLADGSNTNTYGDLTVNGFAAKHLTPQKVDAVGVTGSNYTATNLLALMRKMYKAMLEEYRNNPNNVWMMSRADADLYMDSRSDMTSPSNTTREAVLTGGMYPNFMGHRIVVLPDLYGINETHKYQSSVPGAIIFGDPKNIELAMSSKPLVTTTDFNPRADTGPAYQYDFNGYMDIQIAKPDSFVVAFDGAKVSTPYLVTTAGKSTGVSGKITESSANTYNNDGEDLECVVYCDNTNSVIIYDTSTLSDDYATALAAGTVAAHGETLELTADTYIRAYHPNLTASTEIMFDKTL